MHVLVAKDQLAHSSCYDNVFYSCQYCQCQMIMACHYGQCVLTTVILILPGSGVLIGLIWHLAQPCWHLVSRLHYLARENAALHYCSFHLLNWTWSQFELLNQRGHLQYFLSHHLKKVNVLSY